MFTMKKLFEKEPQKSSAASKMPQKGASHSGHSGAPGTLSGTTRLEHQAWTKNEKQHHALTETAAQASSQARDMLETMMQPKEGAGPQEMTEIMNGIADILRKMDEHYRQTMARMDAIERLLKSRPNG
jgi:hypothetical protein